MSADCKLTTIVDRTVNPLPCGQAFLGNLKGLKLTLFMNLNTDMTLTKCYYLSFHYFITSEKRIFLQHEKTIFRYEDLKPNIQLKRGRQCSPDK